MSNKTSDKGWQRDWATIRSLRGKKLVQYLLDYYTVPFCVTIFAIYVVISAAHMLWEGQRPNRLQVCAVLNNEMSCKAWFDEFFESLTADGKPGRTILNEDQPFSYDNRFSQIQEAGIMALLASQRVDVFVCGEDLYTYLLAINACMDLKEIWKEDLTGGSNARGIFALDLRDTAFAARYNHYNYSEGDGPLYAIVISNTEHLDDSLACLKALAR